MNRETKFTPGPWQYRDRYAQFTNCWLVAEQVNGYLITSDQPYGNWIGTAEANARLIAAAPALYEALRLHMQWIGPPPVDRASFDSLREDAWRKGSAALALVDGKQQTEVSKKWVKTSESRP